MVNSAEKIALMVAYIGILIKKTAMADNIATITVLIIIRVKDKVVFLLKAKNAGLSQFSVEAALNLFILK